MYFVARSLAVPISLVSHNACSIHCFLMLLYLFYSLSLHFLLTTGTTEVCFETLHVLVDSLLPRYEREVFLG